METLLITKLTIKSYLQFISLKKLFSQNTIYNSFRFWLLFLLFILFLMLYCLILTSNISVNYVHFILKLNKIVTLRKNIIIIIIIIEGHSSYNVPYKNILRNTEIYLE